MIAIAPSKTNPKPGEVTGPQTISYSYGDGILSRDMTQMATYATYRTLRKDPTIAMGRGLLISGILASSWSVDADDDISEDVKQFISDVFLPLRAELERATIAYGRIDFGWQGFEKIFAIKNGRIIIERLKPLLHDMTNILIDTNGNFRGYRQGGIGMARFFDPAIYTQGPIFPTDIPVEKCLHIAFDVEGGNYYGMPLLENVRFAQNAWTNCNTYANQYDIKLAGTHWVLKYPPGVGIVDGETLDNGEIAVPALSALTSSGSIALPTTTAAVIQEMPNPEFAKLFEWQVELLSDSGGKQTDFVARLAYLDKLKIRGLILPERTMLEGQYGTKAESEAHADLVITHMEELDNEIVSEVNVQAVDQILELNFGPDMRGKVRLVASPLIDSQIEHLREIYMKILDNPSAALQEIGTIDRDQMKEQLNVPSQEMKEIPQIQPTFVKPNEEKQDGDENANK